MSSIRLARFWRQMHLTNNYVSFFSDIAADEHFMSDNLFRIK
jgi:hypothetical protein